jgi:hypothetical protein
MSNIIKGLEFGELSEKSDLAQEPNNDSAVIDVVGYGKMSVDTLKHYIKDYSNKLNTLVQNEEFLKALEQAMSSNYKKQFIYPLGALAHATKSGLHEEDIEEGYRAGVVGGAGLGIEKSPMEKVLEKPLGEGDVTPFTIPDDKIEGNYQNMGYRKSTEDKYALLDHTFNTIILTTNNFKLAKKEAIEWSDYDDIEISIINQKTNKVVFTVYGADQGYEYFDEHIGSPGGMGQSYRKFKPKASGMMEEYSDLEDRRKAIQDLQMDPDTSKDPMLRKEVIRLKNELNKAEQLEKLKKMNKGNGRPQPRIATEGLDKAKIHAEYKEIKKELTQMGPGRTDTPIKLKRRQELQTRLKELMSILQSKEGVSEGKNKGKEDYDRIKELKSKTNAQLQSLLDFWKKSLEEEPVTPMDHHVVKRAKEQIPLIKSIMAERIGKKGVEEGSVKRISSDDFVKKLVLDFNAEMNPKFTGFVPLHFKSPGTIVWTRGDGARMRDPGYIFLNRGLDNKEREIWYKQDPLEKFWQMLLSKGARKIGYVSGAMGSDSFNPAVVLNKLIFVNNGHNIAWGSTSRLKNSSVWRQKQQEGVEEGWKGKVAGGVLAASALAASVHSPMAHIKGQKIQMAISGSIPSDARLVTDDDGKKIYVWKSTSPKGHGQLMYRPAEQVKEQDVTEGSEKENVEEAGTRAGALNTAQQLYKAIQNSKGKPQHEIDLLKRQLNALARKYQLKPEEYTASGNQQSQQQYYGGRQQPPPPPPGSGGRQAQPNPHGFPHPGDPNWFNKHMAASANMMKANQADLNKAFQDQMAAGPWNMPKMTKEGSSHDPRGTTGIPHTDKFGIRSRGVNLPVADTKDFKRYSNYEKWSRDIERVNSLLLDDSADFKSDQNGVHVTMNGKRIAAWSHRNKNGDIDIRAAKEYSQGITEGALKDIEGQLKKHEQKRIDREKAGDPYVAHEIVSHDLIHKQLLDKRNRIMRKNQKRAVDENSMVKEVTIKDRKTGKEYDPEAEFEKLQNDPEYIAQMKRMSKKDASNLHVNDRVVISGNVNFQGEKGNIESFGRQKAFVIVHLDNYGSHSFHSSDVSYLDDQDEYQEESSIMKGLRR